MMVSPVRTARTSGGRHANNGVVKSLDSSTNDQNDYDAFFPDDPFAAVAATVTKHAAFTTTSIISDQSEQLPNNNSNKNNKNNKNNNNDDDDDDDDIPRQERQSILEQEMAANQERARRLTILEDLQSFRIPGAADEGDSLAGGSEIMAAAKDNHHHHHSSSNNNNNATASGTTRHDPTRRSDETTSNSVAHQDDQSHPDISTRAGGKEIDGDGETEKDVSIRSLHDLFPVVIPPSKRDAPPASPRRHHSLESHNKVARSQHPQHQQHLLQPRSKSSTTRLQSMLPNTSSNSNSNSNNSAGTTTKVRFQMENQKIRFAGEQSFSTVESQSSGVNDDDDDTTVEDDQPKSRPIQSLQDQLEGAQPQQDSQQGKHSKLLAATFATTTGSKNIKRAVQSQQPSSSSSDHSTSNDNHTKISSATLRSTSSTSISTSSIATATMDNKSNPRLPKGNFYADNNDQQPVNNNNYISICKSANDPSRATRPSSEDHQHHQHHQHPGSNNSRRNQKLEKNYSLNDLEVEKTNTADLEHQQQQHRHPRRHSSGADVGARATIPDETNHDRDEPSSSSSSSRQHCQQEQHTHGDPRQQHKCSGQTNTATLSKRGRQKYSGSADDIDCLHHNIGSFSTATGDSNAMREDNRDQQQHQQQHQHQQQQHRQIHHNNQNHHRVATGTRNNETELNVQTKSIQENYSHDLDDDEEKNDWGTPARKNSLQQHSSDREDHGTNDVSGTDTSMDDTAVHTTPKTANRSGSRDNAEKIAADRDDRGALTSKKFNDSSINENDHHIINYNKVALPRKESARSSTSSIKVPKDKENREEPVDRRKLLRKNSSLSELEAMAKRKGRRKTEENRDKQKPLSSKHRDQERQKRMHQSLSRLDHKDSDDDDDDHDDHDNDVDAHTRKDSWNKLSLLEADINTDDCNKSTEEKSKNAKGTRDVGQQHRIKKDKTLNKADTTSLKKTRGLTKSSSKKQLSNSEHNPVSTRKSESADSDLVVGEESTRGRRGVLKKNSSLSDLEEMVESHKESSKREGTKRKGRSYDRLKMHMSLSNLDASVNRPMGEIHRRRNNMDMLQKQHSNSTISSKNLDRRRHTSHEKLSAAHKQNSFSRAVQSDHYPAALTYSGQYHASGDNSLEASKRSSAYDRFKMHQNLSKLRTDYDDIGKLDIYTTNRNSQNVGRKSDHVVGARASQPPERRRLPFRKSSSLSDLGVNEDRATKRSDARTRRNARQSEHNFDSRVPQAVSGSRHQSAKFDSKESLHESSLNSSQASFAFVEDHVESSNKSNHKTIHRDDSRRRIKQSRPSSRREDKNKTGEPMHREHGKSYRTSSTSKTAPPQDTDTKYSTEKDRLDHTESPPRRSSRQVIRKNSSLSDLEAMVKAAGVHNDSELEQNRTMHNTSMSHLEAEKDIGEGPGRKIERGRSKSKMNSSKEGRHSSRDLPRGRSKSQGKGEFGRAKEVGEAEREEERKKKDIGDAAEGGQASKPGRSRSKSQRRKSDRARDRSRSKSQRRLTQTDDKRRSERTRSRSRHRSDDREEKGNEATRPNDSIPRHVFVDNIEIAAQSGDRKEDTEKSSGEASFSSLEGPSVILDARREARKKAKEKRASKHDRGERNKRSTNAGDPSEDLRASTTSLDLTTTEHVGADKHQFDRMNKSMGNLGSPTQRTRKHRGLSEHRKGGSNKLPSPPNMDAEPPRQQSAELALSVVPMSIAVAADRLDRKEESRLLATKERWKVEDPLEQNAIQEMYASFRSIDHNSLGSHEIAALVNSPEYRNFKTSVLEADVASLAKVPSLSEDGDNTSTNNNSYSASRPGLASKWKNRLSTHSLLADHGTDGERPELRKAKSETGANFIQKSSRKLLLELTEEKRRQDPTEQFWSVLHEAFRPLGEDDA